jgi:hypothetical protein
MRTAGILKEKIRARLIFLCAHSRVTAELQLRPFFISGFNTSIRRNTVDRVAPMLICFAARGEASGGIHRAISTTI